jgi:hypothetical protein
LCQKLPGAGAASQAYSITSSPDLGTSTSLHLAVIKLPALSGQTTFSCSPAFDDARRGRDPFLDEAARRSAWITRAFRLVLRSAVFGGDSAFRNGASRPMKMGITASLWRYDGAAHTRPSRVNGDAQRFSIHLVGADLPDSAGWSAHRPRPSWSFRIDARPNDGLRFCVREDCSLQLARVGTQPGIPYVRGECCPCSR